MNTDLVLMLVQNLSGLSANAQLVIDDCISEAYRNAENSDANTPADIAADIAQYLCNVHGVVTYPREG